MDSLTGQLLVASPDKMADEDFVQTVILLVEHNDEGAYGLIINQPTDLAVSAAWAQNHETRCQIDGLVYAGGPCGEFLTALHTQPTLANIEVTPGLSFTQEPAMLAKIVHEGVDPIKFFVGFAGWDLGQLETEVESGSWLLTVLSHLSDVFSYGDDLWPKLARQILTARTMSLLGIEHRPDDPSSN